MSRRSLRGVVASSIAAFGALAVVFAATSGGTEGPAEAPGWATILGVVGGPIVLPLATAATAVALALAGRARAARFLLASVVGAGLITYLAKGMLQVLGADRDGGRLSDYPSGHVAASVALVLGLLAIVWPAAPGRGARLLLVGAAVAVMLAMGWARIETGAHSLVDVAGGAVVAVGWVSVCLIRWPPHDDAR